MYVLLNNDICDYAGRQRKVVTESFVWFAFKKKRLRVGK